MKTAKEVAEIIGNKLILSRCTGEPEFRRIVSFIAQALTAFREEGIEALKDCTVSEVIAKARAEALEDAANGIKNGCVSPECKIVCYHAMLFRVLVNKK